MLLDKVVAASCSILAVVACGESSEPPAATRAPVPTPTSPPESAPTPTATAEPTATIPAQFDAKCPDKSYVPAIPEEGSPTTIYFRLIDLDNLYVGTPVPTPSPNLSIASSEVEREILVKLFRATDGENWCRGQNWLSDKHLAEWEGVYTGRRDGRIWYLDLWNFGLNGEMPLELGGLSSLRILNLGGNSLTGEIPPELGDLSRLWTLNLSGNSLGGSIPPELGNLRNLSYLEVQQNRLSGPVPPQLGQISSLRRLDLGDNQLEGPIPIELRDLSRLEVLRLSNNRLSGEVSDELANLTDLRELYLEGNNLSGCVSDRLHDTAAYLGSPEKCTAESPEDRENLTAVFKALDNGDFWRQWDWLPERQISEWPGVKTGKDGRVAELLLQNTSLDGQMLAALGLLVGLERLDLRGNNLGPVHTT